MPLLSVPIQLVSLPSLSSSRGEEVRSRGEGLEGWGWWRANEPHLQFSNPPLYLSVLLRTTAFEFKSQQWVVFLLWLHHDKSPLTHNGSLLFLHRNVGKGHKMKGGWWFHYYVIECCYCGEALLLKFHPFYYWLSTMDTPLLGKGFRAITSGSLGPGWNPGQVPGACPSSWGEVCLSRQTHCRTLLPLALLFPSLPFFLSLLCSLPHSFPSLFFVKRTHSVYTSASITRVLPFYKRRWV